MTLLQIESHPMIRRSDDRALIAAIAETLRIRGERFTEPRLAVLLVLTRRARAHLAVEEIFMDVQRIDSKINRSSVYRTVETLSMLGLAQQVWVAKGAVRYHLLSAGGPHAHVQCRGCSQVIDLDPGLLADLGGVLLARLQFQLDPHHAALAGFCKKCGPSAP